MSDLADNKNFNYNNMDWNHYLEHRPAYPMKLYDLVYDYHKSHGGGLEEALDIGGGIGVITRDFLLKRFSHTTLSDPSALYISQAQEALAPIADSDRLSFLARKIEDIRPNDLPNGLVDIITAGTCLHWANPLQVAPNAAKLLKSGGTFSAWVYGGRPLLPASHQAAQEAFERLLQQLAEVYERKVQEAADDGPRTNINARFDNIPFDPNEWKNVRRIKVMPEQPMVDARLQDYEWRVLPEVESQEVLDDHAFISRSADYEWLKGFLQSLIPPVDVQANLGPQLEELKIAMGGQELQMKWPFALLLATRR